MQVFHLGYPKCGSTTIQQVLRADPAVNFLGKPYRTPAAEYCVREYLPFADLRQLPADRLAAMRAELCSGNPIISEELLSGIGFRHGIATNSLMQTIDNIELLTQGEYRAHVLLRRPFDLVRSYYGQLAKVGVRMSFDQFCSLVLLRRHHWVFQALNYRAIMESPRTRSGRLGVRLFENVFSGGNLAQYLEETFGSRAGPVDAASARTNMSDSDSTLDAAAAHYPLNPASAMELLVSRPSIQEQVWIDDLPEPDRSMHVAIWASERAEAMAMQDQTLATIAKARAAFGNRRGKRPVSPVFRRLLAEVAKVNAGLDADFPDFGFAEYRYFEVPAE